MQSDAGETFVEAEDFAPAKAGSARDMIRKIIADERNVIATGALFVSC